MSRMRKAIAGVATRPVPGPQAQSQTRFEVTQALARLVSLGGVMTGREFSVGPSAGPAAAAGVEAPDHPFAVLDLSYGGAVFFARDAFTASDRFLGLEAHTLPWNLPGDPEPGPVWQEAAADVEAERRKRRFTYGHGRTRSQR
jgi:hypothetical protein